MAAGDWNIAGRLEGGWIAAAAVFCSFLIISLEVMKSWLVFVAKLSIALVFALAILSAC